MIQIDETRLLDVSRKLHFGAVGADHVRNIVNRANESTALAHGNGTQGQRFTSLYRITGAEVLAAMLGLRRPADLEVLREYLGVRALTSKESRTATEKGIATDSAQQIVFAQQGQGSFPEFDETLVFEVARSEVGSSLSPAHLRQTIAEARQTIGVQPHVGTDAHLRQWVETQIAERGVAATAETLVFSGESEGGHQLDLYHLRRYLGLITDDNGSMGRASHAFANRSPVSERRDFDDYRKAGD